MSNIVAMDQEFLDLSLNIHFDFHVCWLESNLSVALAENSKHWGHFVSMPWLVYHNNWVAEQSYRKQSWVAAIHCAAVKHPCAQVCCYCLNHEMRTSLRRACMDLLPASLMQAYFLNALFIQAPMKCFNDDAYSHPSSCQTNNLTPHLSPPSAALQLVLFRLTSCLSRLENQHIREYPDGWCFWS